MKKYNIKINGTEYSVKIKNVENKIVNLTVNDVPYEVEVEGITTNPTRLTTKEIHKPTLQSIEPVIKPKISSGKAYELRSPLPGVVMELKVKEGDAVKAGQLLLVLEAMKMENNIESDRDGIIEKIKAYRGDAVLEGDVLLTIK
ncbi:biotin/lipoyl-containing protein [Proteiniphilum sp.]|uniref:biotin/lipoyl-containing protein n=1 Tax=Proteiniphilum sp. TaxID=1926877 RepID=UPI002B200073|nr:biotin/lipoyl-containing protein [Proteiniphilum sp.]MEA4919085.1 biotin/lipoyl-containing protein [Proteiniphilum sp.]